MGVKMDVKLKTIARSPFAATRGDLPQLAAKRICLHLLACEIICLHLYADANCPCAFAARQFLSLFSFPIMNKVLITHFVVDKYP
jgi:hypothetical protein